MKKSISVKTNVKDFKDYHYVLVFLALALVLYTSIFMLKFDGLRSPDAMDYAQIARHIYSGNGFDTSSILPSSLASYNSISNHPNLWRPPVYPLLVAASFHIFGVNDVAVTLVSGLFYILLVPLIYLLGKEMFGRKVGLVAGVISLTSLVLVNFGMHGLTETTFTFLFILALYLLYKRASPLLVGFLLGLCYLCRWNLLFFLPALLWFLYKEYPQWKSGLLKVIVVFIVAVSPWWIRNMYLVGNPLFSLHQYDVGNFTTIFPVWSNYRTFHPMGPIDFLISHPLSLVKKVVHIASNLFVEVPRIFASFFVPALALWGTFDIRKGRTLNFFLCILGMAAIQGIAVAMTESTPRYFVPFVPLTVILASYKIVNIIGTTKDASIRRALVGLFIVLILFANIVGIVLISFAAPPYVHEKEINHIRSIVGEHEAIVTDVPWMTSWYCDRAGIWYPVTYESMEHHLAGVNYVYFTSRLRGQARWQSVAKEYIHNPAFREDFELVNEFSSGAMLFKKKEVR